MQGQLCIVIDVNLKWISHEFFANKAHILTHSRREHHYLFIMRCHLENSLHVLSHIKFRKHLVTLIKDKMLKIFHF